MESQLITQPNAASTLGSRACLQLAMMVPAYNPGSPSTKGPRLQVWGQCLFLVVLILFY